MSVEKAASPRPLSPTKKKENGKNLKTDISSMDNLYYLAIRCGSQK